MSSPSRIGVIVVVIVACRPFGEDVASMPPAEAAPRARELPGARVVWEQRIRYGTSWYSGVAQIATTEEGSIFAAGGFANNAELGGAPMTAIGRVDAFVAKIDASGAHAWARRYGSTDTISTVRALATGASGDIYFRGDLGEAPFLARIDRDGNEVWWRPAVGTAHDLRETRDEVTVLGFTSRSVDLGGGSPVSGWFVARATAGTGDHVFGAQLDLHDENGSAPITSPQPLIDASGRFVVPEQGVNDVLVHQYSADGVREHVAQVEVTTTHDRPWRIAVARDGAVFILDAGSIAKRDRSLRPVWRTEITTAGLHDLLDLRDLAPDFDGGVVLAAKYRGRVVIDGHELPEAVLGTRRLVVAKLAFDGHLTWLTTFSADDQSGAIETVRTTRDGQVIIAGHLRGVDLGSGPLDDAFSIVKLRP
jgi:hypothetical protein